MPSMVSCRRASWTTPARLALITAVGPPDCPTTRLPRSARMVALGPRRGQAGEPVHLPTTPRGQGGRRRRRREPAVHDGTRGQRDGARVVLAGEGDVAPHQRPAHGGAGLHPRGKLLEDPRGVAARLPA